MEKQHQGNWFHPNMPSLADKRFDQILPARSTRPVYFHEFNVREALKAYALAKVCVQNLHDGNRRRGDGEQNVDRLGRQIQCDRAFNRARSGCGKIVKSIVIGYVVKKKIWPMVKSCFKQCICPKRFQHWFDDDADDSDTDE